MMVFKKKTKMLKVDLLHEIVETIFQHPYKLKLSLFHFYICYILLSFILPIFLNCLNFLYLLIFKVYKNYILFKEFIYMEKS